MTVTCYHKNDGGPIFLVNEISMALFSSHGRFLRGRFFRGPIFRGHFHPLEVDVFSANGGPIFLVDEISVDLFSSHGRFLHGRFFRGRFFCLPK